MLFATAVALLLRTVAQSQSRTPAPVVDDSYAVSTFTSTSSSAFGLEVKVESPCERMSKLSFALASSAGTLERSGVDGARWDAVIAGDYELSVSGTGWRTHRRRVRLSDDSPRTVVVQLEPSRFVSGRVVTDDAMESVRRFTVRVATRRDREEALGDRIELDDASGGAFCIGGLPLDATELRVLASAPGFADGDTGWFRLGADGATADVVITLVRSAQ